MGVPVNGHSLRADHGNDWFRVRAVQVRAMDRGAGSADGPIQLAGNRIDVDGTLGLTPGDELLHV
jgi:hypothetical protein